MCSGPMVLWDPRWPDCREGQRGRCVGVWREGRGPGPHQNVERAGLGSARGKLAGMKASPNARGALRTPLLPWSRVLGRFPPASSHFLRPGPAEHGLSLLQIYFLHELILQRFRPAPPRPAPTLTCSFPALTSYQNSRPTNAAAVGHLSSNVSLSP